MKEAATVSLCMIVKNEERYLEKSLLSVINIVDEIIIVDTGSTDRTIEIADKYTDNIYNYQWDNDFSAARNFCMSKATSAWILLLDADEVLNIGDEQKISDFIATTTLDGCHFTVYNYIGDGKGYDYTTHQALRLLRNNNCYYFTGRIHEQLTSINRESLIADKFSCEDIVLHHYGYLDTVASEKMKRERNIPLLLELIAAEPNNYFQIFNLGNEYLAQKDHVSALEQYVKAYQNLDINQAYVPHLLYRMLTCLYELKEYEKAIYLADQAFSIYPRCADILFFKGIILSTLKHYTLAIDCFKKCIEMEEPPHTLKLLNGCTTFRPYLSLGDLYEQLDDYDSALFCYTQAINLNNSLYYVLYKIGMLLRKKYADSNDFSNHLAKYFSNLEYLPNIIVYTDILIAEKAYSLASDYIDIMRRSKGYDADKLYLGGKLAFYTRQFTSSYEEFKKLMQIVPLTKTTLPNVKSEGLSYMFISALVEQNDNLGEVMTLINKHNDKLYRDFYRQLYYMYTDKNEIILNDTTTARQFLDYATSFFDKLLHIQEFELLENCLYILNYINNDEVLLALANVYYQNGFKDIAVKTILKSIKELGKINPDAARILFREVR